MQKVRDAQDLKASWQKDRCLLQPRQPIGCCTPIHNALAISNPKVFWHLPVPLRWVCLWWFWYDAGQWLPNIWVFASEVGIHWDAGLTPTLSPGESQRHAPVHRCGSRRCRAIRSTGNLSQWSYAFCISHRYDVRIFWHLPSFCMFCLCGRYLIASFPKDFKISYARRKSKCFSRTGCWVHWNLNLWFIHGFAGRLPDPTWRPLVVRNLSNPSVLAVDEQNKRLQKSASRTDDSLVKQDYKLGGIRNKMERFRY